MKRFMCIFVSILMLVSIFPFHVFANECTTSQYDELIELACEVFPEYASAIRSENTSYNSRAISTDCDKIVYQETRSISDTESLSIALTSSGNAIVLKQNYEFFILSVPSSNSTDITNVGISGTATFDIASYGYHFKLSNVQYTIYYYSGDYFTNYGYVSANTFITHGLIEESPSRISYYVRVGTEATSIVYLDLYFSNNQLIAELD